MSESPYDEIRALADAMFDGRIDSLRMQRLESLIVNDLGCMQAYVERMTFHGELLQGAEERTPEQAAVAVLKEFSRAVRLRERHNWIMQFWIYSAMAATVLLVVGTAYVFTDGFQGTPLGVISSLSENAQSETSPMDLGRVVRLRELFTIKSGIVSLQLPNVTVDVLGPATLQLENSSRITLKSGTVKARVSTGGEGFVVTTPDAEVVDLGTEFLVHHNTESGTDVSVRQGRARASLLNWGGKPTKILELTDHRSATFQRSSQTAKEVNFLSDAFAPIDQSRGGIHSIDGTIRTATRTYVALFSGQVQTPNHMLVIPELQNVLITEELTVTGIGGPVRIPAGSTISSYLMHYDPTAAVTIAPRGAVTFFDQIAAVIVDADALRETDQNLGLPGVQFEPADFRQFELDEDIVQISRDRRTVSFYCGLNPAEFLDEARILVLSNPAPPPTPARMP